MNWAAAAYLPGAPLPWIEVAPSTEEDAKLTRRLNRLYAARERRRAAGIRALPPAGCGAWRGPSSAPEFDLGAGI